MDKQNIDWSNLTPEQTEILRSQVFAKQTEEPDPYRDGIVEAAVARAVAETERRLGGYVGSTAKHVAISRLTEGLSEKAKERLLDQLKEKKVEEVVYLSEDDTYRVMLRDSSEMWASKQEKKEDVVTDDKGEGTRETVTQEVSDYKKEMKTLMGVEFTDEQAAANLKELKNTPEVAI